MSAKINSLRRDEEAAVYKGMQKPNAKIWKNQKDICPDFVKSTLSEIPILLEYGFQFSNVVGRSTINFIIESIGRSMFLLFNRRLRPMGPINLITSKVLVHKLVQ